MKKNLPQSFTKSIGKSVLMGSKLNLFIVLLLISSLSFAQSKSASTNKKKVEWRSKSANQNATFYDVQKDFQKFEKVQKRVTRRNLRKGIRDEDEVKGVKSFKRWENYMAPRVYPSGDMGLPSTAYGNYMEWLQSNNLKSATANASNWTALGPLVKPTGYDAGVGRVDFVRFDPTNSNTLYVGTPDGGLWKSTNGGTSWTTNTDFLPVIGIADLVIDPTNTQNMYIATGSWEKDKVSRGVWKSTNGGASWNPTGLSFEASEEAHVKRLLMHPDDPDILLVSAKGGNGIYRSVDGGENWSEPTTDDYLGDMKFKPGDPNTVYAASKLADTPGIYKSTDNGASWTKITSGLPTSDVSRIVLGVTADEPTYVYALIGNEAGGYKGLYRSTDSGDSYSVMSTTPNILNSSIDGSGTGGQASHDLAIAVSPTDADKVTIGGINQWRSLDGGGTWELFTYWYGVDPNIPGSGEGTKPYIHADVQDIQYLPGSSTTLFTTCDGGISKSTNDGDSWTDISNNLVVAQQTNIASSTLTPELMFTGLQDIGTLKNSNGTWTYIGGGDGEAALVHRSDDKYMMVSEPSGGHSMSDDGGANTYSLSGNLPKDAEWYSPLAQDPVNDNLIYAGGRPALWKTDRLWIDLESAAWTELGTPAGDGNILQFVVAPSNPAIIYAIKIDKISKSINSGAAWTDITGTLPSGSAFSNLTISDTDPDKVWLTFSGYTAANKVFKTTDGGTSWTNISDGLPNIPMNCIVYHNGSTNDAVYMGGDIGVFYRDNTKTSWELFNNGLPNTHVSDLEIQYTLGKLRTATYGRGAWETSIPAVVRDPVDWTMLVYLCGSDSESKSSSGTKDIEEMIQAGTTDWVNVVVLTGGSDKEGWRIPKCWLIKNGAKIPQPFVPSTADMGSPQTLTEFIDWGIQNYPANSTMLTIWNHGAALGGAAFDKVSGKHLSVPDLKQGIGNSNFIKGGKYFDALGFDAGLMANLEVMSNLKDFAYYYVASEEEEAGHGWDYTSIIKGMESGNALEGNKIGKIIADSYKAQAIASTTDGATHGITLSITNLDYISDLETNFASLVEKIEQDSKVRVLQQARGKAEEYGIMIQEPEHSVDVVDIGDLMNKLKGVDSELSTEADVVLSTLNNAVVYNIADETRPFASGISMYMPHNSFNNKAVLNDFFSTTYTPLEFSSTIKDFISDTYTTGVLADYTPPSGETGDNLKSISTDGISWIKVSHDDDLEQIQVILVEEFEGFQDEYIALGSAYPDTAVVNDDGTVSYGYHFDDYWMGINGYAAYVADLHFYELEDSAGNIEAFTRAYIPAILNPDNGENEQFISLAYRYDEDFNVTLEGIIPEEIDDNGRVPLKERITLVPGDRVQLLYEGFNEVTDEEFFVVDDRAIFEIKNGSDDLELGYGMLDEANFHLGWLLSDYSQNDTLIFDTTMFEVVGTSVDVFIDDSDISFFPNPADQKLVVEYKGVSGTKYTVRLVDISGKLCFTQTYSDQKVNINTSQLQSGIYTVEILSDGLRYNDKLIITH